MKKSRPAVSSRALPGRPGRRRRAILFRETTTCIRRWPVERRVLPRAAHRVETPLGAIDGKIGWLDDGTVRFSPEFESCRQIAERQGIPLGEVFDAARRGFHPERIAPPANHIVR